MKGVIALFLSVVLLMSEGTALAAQTLSSQEAAPIATQQDQQAGEAAPASKQDA